MNELENIITFFNENTVVKESVSVKRINELAGLPNNTLNQATKGYKYRTLSEEQIAKLIPVIVKIGYKPVDSENSLLKYKQLKKSNN